MYVARREAARISNCQLTIGAGYRDSVTPVALIDSQTILRGTVQGGVVEENRAKSAQVQQVLRNPQRCAIGAVPRSEFF